MFLKKKKYDFSVLPERLSHIAFIMDGNGRWARKRSLPRSAGHSAGADNFKKIIRHCFNIGIRYVTVYAFSTENWKRPKEEIDALMKIFTEYIEEAASEFEKYDVSIRFIGDRATLPYELAAKMAALETKTAGKLNTVNIALNYGGRAEIVSAVNSLIAKGAESVTEEDVSRALYTAGSPDPDLVVRTGGESRVSNFLMWQSAYSEYYFTKTLWPDLSSDEINAAVNDFLHRQRRWGRTGDQVESDSKGVDSKK